MRNFLCGVAARMNASVLPRRCKPMPDQLPTENIGTLILSHCACEPRNAPLSRLLCSQKCSVLICQPSGRCCDGASQQMMQKMRGVPIGHEQREDAAMVQRVAVEIGKSLPWNDRLQRRRLQIGYEPLIDGEIGDAEEPDIAVAPRLRRRPFDRHRKGRPPRRATTHRIGRAICRCRGRRRARRRSRAAPTISDSRSPSSSIRSALRQACPARSRACLSDKARD